MKPSLVEKVNVLNSFAVECNLCGIFFYECFHHLVLLWFSCGEKLVEKGGRVKFKESPLSLSLSLYFFVMGRC
jgi:hypothetical protein